MHLFTAAAYFDCCNRSQEPCYGPFKLTPSYYINLIGVSSLFISYWPPPPTRDAVSATIVFGGWAQIQLNRNKYELTNFYINLLNLLNRFNGGIGTRMRKAAHPLGGVDSSNPHRWRGERLHPWLLAHEFMFIYLTLTEHTCYLPYIGETIFRCTLLCYESLLI